MLIRVVVLELCEESLVPVWCGQAGEGRGVLLTSKEMFWNGIVDLFERYGRRCEWFAESSSMVVLINRTSDGDWKNEQTNLASYSGPFRKNISESEGGKYLSR